MLRRLVLVALISLTPLSADVVYHLTDGLASFQYTAPDFITSTVTIQGANLDSCVDPYSPGSTCLYVEFAPVVGALGGLAEIAWAINTPGFGESVGGFDYSPGTFSVPGHHTDIDGGGGLDITVVTTPEPGSVFLLAPAALLLLRRWRKNRGQ